MDLTPPETGLRAELRGGAQDQPEPDTLRSSSVESLPKPLALRAGKPESSAGSAQSPGAKSFIKRAWAEASMVQRLLLFLVPMAGAALAVSGPEALGLAAAETSGASSVAAAAPAPGARAVAPGPTQPAAVAAAPTPPPVEPAIAVAVPPRVAAAPERAAPAPKELARAPRRAPLAAGSATPERAAVDALVSGNRAAAREHYAGLSRKNPSNPAFAAAERALAEPENDGF
jgi:hypothetical protein